MPVLKHAKKKLRQDKKRTLMNKKMKETFRSLLKKARVNPTPEAVSLAVSAIDKAEKNNLMHKNKAARMKSALSKVAAGTSKTAAPTKKTTAAKKKEIKKSAKKSSKKK